MDYQQLLANVVLPKLKEFGKPLVLRKNIDEIGTWEKKFNSIEMRHVWENTVTGEISLSQPSQSTLSYTVDMLVDTIKKKEIDGDLVKAGDIKIYMSPIIEPILGDIIELDGKDYIIYHMETIKPSTVTLLYVLYVRNI